MLSKNDIAELENLKFVKDLDPIIYNIILKYVVKSQIQMDLVKSLVLKTPSSLYVMKGEDLSLQNIIENSETWDILSRVKFYSGVSAQASISAMQLNINIAKQFYQDKYFIVDISDIK